MIATLDFPKLLTSQKLIKLFTLMDRDGDNFISSKDIYLFTGKKLEMEQCRKMLDECTEQLNIPLNEAAKLNFANFKNIVMNQGLVGKKNDPDLPGPQLIIQNTGFANLNSYLYQNNDGGGQSKKMMTNT